MTILAGRIGLWTGTLDTQPVPQLRELVAELDAQGWGALWFGEAYGREAFTNAALMLAASERMTIATGIANLWARDAVAMNGAARTLDEAFPGRFLLGIGISHAPLVERMRGHEYAKPIATMRSYLDAMDGAPFAAAGADAPRSTRVLAALGPAALALARDRADGSHPYLVTPEHTASAREILGPDAILAVEQGVVLDSDPDVWSTRAHAHLNIYTGLPNYVNNWRRLGFAEEDFVRGGSPRLAEALVVRGERAIADRVREHFEAGASHVCLQVLGDGFEPPRADWARLAQVLLG